VTSSDPRPAGSTGDPLSTGLPGDRVTGPPTGSAGPVASGPPPSTGQRARSTGRAIGRTLALALLILVTVVLVLFVVYNTQTVEVSLVFTDVRAPLVVALLIAAVLGGALIGLIDAVMTLRGRRRSR
jgi:uncharacterized integral membrane protein